MKKYYELFCQLPIGKSITILTLILIFTATPPILSFSIKIDKFYENILLGFGCSFMIILGFIVFKGLVINTPFAKKTISLCFIIVTSFFCVPVLASIYEAFVVTNNSPLKTLILVVYASWAIVITLLAYREVKDEISYGVSVGNTKMTIV